MWGRIHLTQQCNIKQRRLTAGVRTTYFSYQVCCVTRNSWSESCHGNFSFNTKNWLKRHSSISSSRHVALHQNIRNNICEYVIKFFSCAREAKIKPWSKAYINGMIKTTYILIILYMGVCIQGWAKEMELSWEKVSAQLQPATAGHARLLLSKTVPFFCTTLYKYYFRTQYCILRITMHQPPSM